MAHCGLRYLSRRGDQFQIRLVVPKDLHRRVGRKELRWSLKTSDRTTARRRALRASLAFEELCDMIRTMKTLDSEHIKTLIRAFFQSLVKNHALPPPVHPGDQKLEQEYQSTLGDEVVSELTEQIETFIFNDATKNTAHRLVRDTGAEFEALPPTQQRAVLEGVARAQREYAHYTLHTQKTTLDDYLPKDPFFAETSLQSIASPSPTVPTPLSPTDSTPPTPQSLQPGSGGTVTERIEQYLEDGDWAEKTRDEKIGVLQWFEELLGSNTDVRTITIEHIIAFKNAVSHLRLHTKTGIPLKEAQTSIPEQRIGAKTAKKKLDTAKAFLNWLMSVGAIHSIPGTGVTIKVKKTSKSKQRRPFTAEELGTLFSSPMYRGCKSAKQRYMAGKVLLKDDFYWMPLVLFYTGMRLAEPLQIAAADVIIDTETPYFDLDNEKINLKADVSDRFVPIHPDLVEFGFLKFVQKRQKSKPKDRLFRQIISKGEISNYYSKWLGRYIDKIGLTDPRLVAHSFRHGFKDALRNAAVPEGEQKFIMGHSSSEAAHYYGSGSDIGVLWNWVATLDLRLPENVKAELRIKPKG